MAHGIGGDKMTSVLVEDDGQRERRPDGAMKPPYRVPSMAEIAAVRPNGFRVVSTFAGCGGSSLGYRMAGFKVLWASEFVERARIDYAANAAPGTIVDGRDIREVDPHEVLRTLGLQPGDLDVLDGSPPCASFSTAGKREKGWGKVKSYSDKEQRTDDLFFEYVRFLDAMRPRVFVAENVSGLVKGTAKGYFLKILAAMKACGYRVEARLLDAQWLGVPQQRQRIIFQGVREDVGLEPAFPSPFPYRYSVRDALPWIGAVGGIRETGFSGSKMTRSSNPSPTVMAGGGNGMNTSQFGVEVETDISKQAIGREYDKLNPGQSSDRYFNLVRSDAGAPSPTVTAAGGMNSGIACVVHPTEKRKFSIAELKRICAFPDSFVLSGTYAQQWERLGRAVPPLMMFAVAVEVARTLERARTPGPRRRSSARSTSGKVRKDEGRARTAPTNGHLRTPDERLPNGKAARGARKPGRRAPPAALPAGR
jgi:DNA (cytosine-5)-methyltransferase 1